MFGRILILPFGLLPLLVVALILFSLYAYTHRLKTVQGIVIDCDSHFPIDGAKVKAIQRSLIPGDEETVETSSDKTGQFTITYKVGDVVNLHSEKLGYYEADQFNRPDDEIVVRMLQGKPTGFDNTTIGCKPSRECLTSKEQGGVAVSYSICDQSGRNNR